MWDEIVAHPEETAVVVTLLAFVVYGSALTAWVMLRDREEPR